MPRQLIASILLCLCVCLSFSCKQSNPSRKFRIGFSQCQNDEWRSTMQAEIEREIELSGKASLVFRDAGGSNEKQIEQIEELASSGIDLLLVSPNTAAALTPVISKVFRNGLPVVIIDRKVNSPDYTAFVGASNYEIGQNAARYASKLLGGRGQIIEVAGLPTATPFVERELGFRNIISQFSGIQYLGKVTDNDPDYKRKLRQFMSINPRPYLVFSQSDYIALEVCKARKELGLDNQLKIIGVDGLPSDTLGMGMVAKKLIDATVLYPTGGQEAVQTAIKILEHQPYSRENILETIIIDSSNVRMLKLQSDRLKAQQNEIVRGNKKIQEQIDIASNQNTIIITISAALALALIFGSVFLYYLQENQKINRRLEHQNQEIAEQKNRVTQLMEKLQEALHAKSRFFTNVSHEFRTPLTLILAPIEDLVENPRMPAGARQTVQMVQRNVMRLYRLVNQLMDFRKIEEDKMQVRATENDLVAFVREITENYNQLARKKSIDLAFHTSERVLPAWFDAGMFDKVIFNLLSNAFKFTQAHGHILVSVSRTESDAVIIVEDNGIGMSRESLGHAFEPFFQGEYENYKGSGLGLALSKKFMDLHKGTIQISSDKGKGTRFEIHLPLGSSHFAEHELISHTASVEDPIHEDADTYLAEFQQGDQMASNPAEEPVTPSREHSVLVVEDDADLRNYLHDRLKKKYYVLLSQDGNAGLSMALDSRPDLVICDVVMPGRNGLELTQLLKKDVRTAHIPVVLLTSRTSDLQKLEGMAAEADAYITKPFSFSILEKTVDNLLANRQKIRSHYTAEVFVQEKQQAEKKTDRKFLNEFASIVESNIANEQFSIEEICRHMGISKVQLYRKVNALLQCSVNDYIISCRLQQAKHYLLHDNLSIAEIAAKTGFGSSNYFSTVFKSRCGQTPSEFKSKGERREQ